MWTSVKMCTEAHESLVAAIAYYLVGVSIGRFSGLLHYPGCAVPEEDPNYAILCYAILCYTILYYIIQYYTKLYYAILY